MIRLPKIRELIEACKAIILGPYTSGYPKVPTAVSKRFRGKPAYSDAGCVGCGACAHVCPVRAIECVDTVPGKAPRTRKMVLHLDECHYCGQCSALCTTKNDPVPGIDHTREYELAGYDRRSMVSCTGEKELVVCEVCDDVITTKEHLVWIAAKIGTLSYSNPSLYLTAASTLGIDISRAPGISGDTNRSDRLRVLCAKCKRVTTIER